jgi:hypothetical protein
MSRRGIMKTSAADIKFAALSPLVPDRDIEAESTFVTLPPGAKARAECAVAATITACPTTSVSHSATADIIHNTKSP